MILFLAVSLSVLAGGLILFVWTRGDSVPGCVIVVVGFLAASAAAVMWISLHYDTVGCHRFAETTGRQTKFVRYTYWTWDCLTPTADGKWIPTKNLREFGGKP